MTRALAYFDTSVLVKRYVDEPGAALARALLRRYEFLSSTLAPVEALSALVRRRRNGEMTAKDFAAITERLRKDRAMWELVGIGTELLEQAEEVVCSTGASTLDAIHLASARSVCVLSGQRIPFVTADARQRAAAARLDIEVVWVE